METGHNCKLLEQEIELILSNITEVQIQNEIAQVSQASHSVKDVSGKVELAAAPYYGLTFNSDTEQPFVLPLIVVDSAKDISKWVSIVGKRVQIKHLLVVLEKFQIIQKREDLQCINVIAKWEDIIILDSPSETKVPIISDNHQKTSTSADNEIPLKNKENVTSNTHSYRIIVHNVSMPFKSHGSSTCCLAFVSFINRKHLEEKLWLVLRAGQVAWREFLISNREYILQFPSQIDPSYIEKSQMPLNKIFTQPIRELAVVFHHITLFSTLNGLELPVQTKIFLTSNTDLSVFVNKFTKDPFTPWFSADEADCANVELVTLYGQVDCVIYSKEEVFKSCYLCIRAKPKVAEPTKPICSTSHNWTNPWNSSLSIGSDDMMELPSVEEEDNSTMKTGVPGNMVQIIKLRDLITANEKSVYIKHSYALNSLQLFRLTAGMVICITYLNRRCSSSGKYYYISTVLSNFKVLSYCESQNKSEGWGAYGLHQLTPNSRDKIWGELESYNLRKVGINAKCSTCKVIVSKGQCSECSETDGFTVSAYAICWLRIIHEKGTVSLEKVLIKDNHVQKLLSIPDEIWQSLLKIAVDEEIVCFVNDRLTKDTNIPSGINGLLKIYCDVVRPKNKFYISVRKMSTQSEEEALYYCIHLEPVNEEMLKMVADQLNVQLK